MYQAISKENMKSLSQWDAKGCPLAPLTEKQRASIVELSTFNKRSLPEKVGLISRNNLHCYLHID